MSKIASLGISPQSTSFLSPSFSIATSIGYFTLFPNFSTSSSALETIDSYPLLIMKFLFTSPISTPAAQRTMFPTIPVVKIESAVPLLNTFSITSIESSGFIPPSRNTQGCSTLSSAFWITVSSFSITLPAAEGVLRVKPTKDAWDLWAAANASLTK